MTRKLLGVTSALAGVAALASAESERPATPKPRERAPKRNEFRPSTRRWFWEKATSNEGRRELCAKHRVKNTGRQWRKLRKRLGLAVRIKRAY
jgi:hypothetical protein